MNYRSLIGANASLLSGLASQDASPPNQTINTYSNPSNIKRFDSLVNSIASAGAQFEVPNPPSHHHRKIINPNGLKPRVHRNINGITDTDPTNDMFIDPSGVRPRYHRNINGISNGSRFIDPSGVKPRVHRNINAITDNVYYDDVDSYSDDYEEPIVDPTIPDTPTPDPEPEPPIDSEPTPENNGQFIPPPPVYRKPSMSVYTIVIIIIVILLLVLIFKIANEQKQLTRVINRATNY